MEFLDENDILDSNKIIDRDIKKNIIRICSYKGKKKGERFLYYAKSILPYLDDIIKEINEHDIAIIDINEFAKLINVEYGELAIYNAIKEVMICINIQTRLIKYKEYSKCLTFEYRSMGKIDSFNSIQIIKREISNINPSHLFSIKNIQDIDNISIIRINHMINMYKSSIFSGDMFEVIHINNILSYLLIDVIKNEDFNIEYAIIDKIKDIANSYGITIYVNKKLSKSRDNIDVIFCAKNSFSDSICKEYYRYNI